MYACGRLICTGVGRSAMSDPTKRTSRMAWMDSMAICGSVLALTVAASAALAAPEQVDLKLVLAVDVSGSINDEELRVERDGTADAFLNPDVIQAIQSGALGKIAV